MTPEEFYKPLEDFKLHFEGDHKMISVAILIEQMFENFNKASGEEFTRLEQLAVNAFNAH